MIQFVRIIFIVIGFLYYIDEAHCQVDEINIDTICDSFYFIKEYKLDKDIILYDVFDRTDKIRSVFSKSCNLTNGIYISYYPSSAIESVLCYEMDVPVGKYVKFYETGIIRSVYDYRHDSSDKFLIKQREVTFDTLQFPPYDIIQRERFFYKRLNGPYYHYYPDGSLEKIEMYTEDKADGYWRYFRQDGSLYKKENWVMGKLVNTELF